MSPRAPFSLLADILGASEQTVARRYRRMYRAGLLRVIGVVRPDALGQSTWMVRVRCRPNGASSLASALAQRDDVSWVTLVSAGSEVMCAVRSLTREARDDLLVQRLPRTAPVLGVEPAVVLHVFVGASIAQEWSELAGLLDRDQERRLRGSAEPIVELTRTASLDASDAALVDLLAADGRASYTALATAAGASESWVTRRLAALLRSGVVYIDVDVAMSALGLHGAACLWLRVGPAQLDAAGAALSQHPEVAFAAAVSGPHNLMASIYCHDLDELYAFVTAKIGAIPGVQSMEISPVLRHVKQSGALVDGDRFVD
jgi:DNA-binding Lrp family transcriptional regulator